MWYQRLLYPTLYDVPNPNCETPVYLECTNALGAKYLNENRESYGGTGWTNLGFTDWKTPRKVDVQTLLQGGPASSVGHWLSSEAGLWGPVGTQGTPAALPDVLRERGEERAWTSSVRQFGICAPSCPEQFSSYVVNLQTGQIHDVLGNYQSGHVLWNLAYRPIAQCEFYYDDATKPSPAC